MGIVIFNGVSSQVYHIQVEHPPDYETPEKDYETTHVPGRNGDIYIDTGSYKNVTRTYQIAVGSENGNFTQLANGISNWLHSANGYARLEDTYEPDYYRIASYVEGGTVENILEHAGRITISFDCKPQRFLKLGDEPVEFVDIGTIWNPTQFQALPTITVRGEGEGVLGVGNYKVMISDIGESITINSDIQDIYNEETNTNKNSLVTLPSGFPKLDSGDNEISFTGGIEEVEVVPKWWTL